MWRLLLALVLAVPPIFYLAVSGGGIALGDGYRVIPTLASWTKALRIASLLLSPICGIGAIVHASLTTFANLVRWRIKVLVWILAAATSLATGIVIFDILVGIAM